MKEGDSRRSEPIPPVVLPPELSARVGKVLAGAHFTGRRLMGLLLPSLKLLRILGALVIGGLSSGFCADNLCDVCFVVLRGHFMKGFARTAYVFLVIAASVLPAATQTVIMPREIGVSSYKHKPFTANARTTLSRVFSSGTERTVKIEDRIARDGEGRVMREQHFPWTEDPAYPIYYVNILDPKRMENIHIDPQRHAVVTRPVDRTHAWDYVPYDGTQYRLAVKPGVTVHTELLGNKQINGLKCWGQRTTYLFSPGAFRGNQQPLTRTWEVWYSKDLGSDVRIVTHDPDPKAGDQETNLINIGHNEPDPAIFDAPAGYSIETAPR